MSKVNIFIGTSGWNYKNWNHLFYPLGVTVKQQLNFYSEHFDTVEINSTFYRLPSEETIRNWSLQVPKQFVFSIKASRFITHTKRLKNYEETTPRLFEKIQLLGSQLGPCLFQLPATFKKDREQLKEFLNHLPLHMNYVFEFRHSSWFTDEIYELLNKHQIALCITDLKGSLSPEIVTSTFTYIRLHGPQFAYRGSYGLKRLKEWKQKILAWADHHINVYCYFDNTDEEGHALKDAKELKNLIHQENYLF